MFLRGQSASKVLSIQGLRGAEIKNMHRKQQNEGLHCEEGRGNYSSAPSLFACLVVKKNNTQETRRGKISITNDPAEKDSQFAFSCITS